jgi:hypothetical protein
VRKSDSEYSWQNRSKNKEPHTEIRFEMSKDIKEDENSYITMSERYNGQGEIKEENRIWVTKDHVSHIKELVFCSMCKEKLSEVESGKIHDLVYIV